MRNSIWADQVILKSTDFNFIYTKRLSSTPSSTIVLDDEKSESQIYEEEFKEFEGIELEDFEEPNVQEEEEEEDEVELFLREEIEKKRKLEEIENESSPFKKQKI
jgi:hypothetical protein